MASSAARPAQLNDRYTLHVEDISGSVRWKCVAVGFNALLLGEPPESLQYPRLQQKDVTIAGTEILHISAIRSRLLHGRQRTTRCSGDMKEEKNKEVTAAQVSPESGTHAELR